MDKRFQSCFIEDLLWNVQTDVQKSSLFAFSSALCIKYQFSSQISHPQCKLILIKTNQCSLMCSRMLKFWYHVQWLLGMCTLSPAVLGATALRWNLICNYMHWCFVAYFEGTEVWPFPCSMVSQLLVDTFTLCKQYRIRSVMLIASTIGSLPAKYFWEVWKLPHSLPWPVAKQYVQLIRKLTCLPFGWPQRVRKPALSGQFATGYSSKKFLVFSN